MKILLLLLFAVAHGSITYSGTSRGAGYLEMTGYDKAMKL